MCKLVHLILGLLCFLLTTTPANSAVPQVINFQGRLTNATGTPLAGTYSVMFTIYDAASGGTSKWQETQSITTDANGLFATLLGAVVPVPDSVFRVSGRFLGVKVGGDPELTPRTRLVTSAYAYRVSSIDGASGGTVYGTVQISGSGYATATAPGTALSAVSQVGDLNTSNIAVNGFADGSYWNNYGVYGRAYDGTRYSSTSAGIYGTAVSRGGTVWAGYFDGWVNVTGTFYAAAKSFRIDDPTDPANSVLQHACVESNEYKNIYDGLVTLDNQGRATVALPDWFDHLNTGFRYQLTCVGGYAPVYIAAKVNNNQFTIAGGSPGLEVSWMITGVRKDPYAMAHPVEVRKSKPEVLRGKYLHPVEYGVDEKLGVDYAARQYGQELEKQAAERVNSITMESEK